MNYITNEIRNRFKVLRVNVDTNGIIEYLSSILATSCIDDKLAGFCYWNISDSYAILRKSNEVFDNHLKFCKRLENMNSKYKFWAVCDTTQKFTLELGGFSDFWWELYKNAVDSNPNTANIECIVFDSHVAAISINPKVDTPKSRLYLAKDNFEKFVKASANTENEAFYKLVYSSLVLKGFGDEEYDILNLCHQVMPFLKEKTLDNEFAVGEWERLNSPRSRKNTAQVGINHAINAFISVGNSELAADLYNEALKNGLTPNSYIRKRIKLSNSN